MAGSRSRSGCWTCRSKSAKKRCDQQRPSCGRCSRLDLLCDYTSRPSLAERRRAKENKTLAQSRASGGDDVMALTPMSLDVSISELQQPASPVASCSLTLTNVDHEAIRYFRTDFAKLHHTKNPDYSLISLMFNTAQNDAMIMNMVLALGLQEMNLKRIESSASSERRSVMYYSSALRMLSESLALQDTAKDLENLLTALWLMLLYEQQFGDPGCKAYSSHLQGVASLLRLRGERLLELPSGVMDDLRTSVVSNETHTESQRPRISQYAARVLVWIALLDAGAASVGIGGQVNAAIFSLTLLPTPDDAAIRYEDPVKAFSVLHRFSNPLYRISWGDAYPQSELLDDVENRNIYSLLGSCVALRFMIAQLATLYRNASSEASAKTTMIRKSLHEVSEQYCELIDVADELSMKTDNSHRLVANIRAIVPFYHAVVLDFMRVTAFNEPLNGRQRFALKSIMNLAYQSYKHGGDEALLRVAWPLFLAVLETDDMLHRDWILDRFTTLRKYGKNYERAHRFLVDTISRQQSIGRRVNLRDQLDKLDLFVLA